MPDELTIAAALRTAFLARSDGHASHRRTGQARLIEAIIDALEGGTLDGWKLELKGRKGPRRTFADADRNMEIGLFFSEQISLGAGYESAISATIDKFSCSRTTATGCIRFETSPIGGVGEVSKLASIGKGRGGSRNRADRESLSLTAAQVGNLIAAEQHARAIGLPFTRMITVHWEAAGISLEGMVKATGRFIDLLTKTLARHGSETAWLWVHEGGPDKGGHCHILAYVPADLAALVSRRQMKWLRRIASKPYRARVIQSKPIGLRLGLERGNPDLHAVNLEAALAYVLKGADRQAASKFGLTRLEPGGRVIGKRCGVSQNIGPKARSPVAGDQRESSN